MNPIDDLIFAYRVWFWLMALPMTLFYLWEFGRLCLRWWRARYPS